MICSLKNTNIFSCGCPRQALLFYNYIIIIKKNISRIVTSVLIGYLPNIQGVSKRHGNTELELSLIRVLEFLNYRVIWKNIFFYAKHNILKSRTLKVSSKYQKKKQCLHWMQRDYSFRTMHKQARSWSVLFTMVTMTMGMRIGDQN